MINLPTIPAQFLITQLRRQMTVRHTQLRCTGLVPHQVRLTFTVRCKLSFTCTVRNTQLGYTFCKLFPRAFLISDEKISSLQVVL